MTDRECLGAAIAISIFAHFLFLLGSRLPESPRGQMHTVLHMEMDAPAAPGASEPGMGVANATPEQLRDMRAAQRKRKAFLEYLEAIDEAVHARRFESGDTSLIGVATYAFVVEEDGRFRDIRLHAPSGNSRLDEAARRAVLAASGTVKRPAIIGHDPVAVLVQVKYQYGLR